MRDILKFSINIDIFCLSTELIFRKLFKDSVVKIKIWDTDFETLTTDKWMLLYCIIYIALKELC